MAQKFEYTVLDLLESAVRTVKTTPLNLGGLAGGGGGVGGPPGGFIGWLPQTRVAYDTSEIAASGIPASGVSLLDNMNHIRYRLNILESGGGTAITVMDFDGVPTVSNVDTIIFSGAIITNLGGGNVLVRMAGGGSGGGIEDAPLDNDVYGRLNGEWVHIYSISDVIENFVRLSGTGAGEPITGTIEIINDFDTGAGLYVQTMGDAYTGDFEQFGYSAETVHSPVMFLYRGAGDASNVDFDAPLLSLSEDNGHGLSNDAPVFDYRYNGDIYWRFSPRQNSYNYVFNTVNNAGGNTIFSVQHDLTEVFHITGSGGAYDIDGRLVSEAPINGSGYMRKNGAWVTVSGVSGGSGFGDNAFYIDQSGGTADTYHILGGAVNGSNAVFTTSQAKYVSGSLKVYLNGQLQTQGSNEDWVETSPSTGTFTFNTAPASTDLITAEYLIVTVATGNADTLDGIDSTGFVLKKPWFAFNESDQTFELGANAVGKINPAGVIGYNTYGADFLYIVGSASGVFSSNRNVKIFDNLYVDNNLYINGGQVLVAGKQVTNGDSHDHLGGDGGQINHTSLSNIGTTTHADLDTIATTGWIPISTTWTRTGNHTFTISGSSLVTIYRKGTKIRYKDGGSYEYAVVGSSSFAGSTTTVNLIPNTDYAMAAVTITDTYISYIENPEGFPALFNFTTTVSASAGTLTSYTVQQAIWTTWGSQIKVDVTYTLTNIGTGTGTTRFSTPVAAAGLYYGFGRENVVTGSMLQGTWSSASSVVAWLTYNNGAVITNNYQVIGTIIGAF